MPVDEGRGSVDAGVGPPGGTDLAILRSKPPARCCTVPLQPEKTVRPVASLWMRIPVGVDSMLIRDGPEPVPCIRGAVASCCDVVPQVGLRIASVPCRVAQEMRLVAFVAHLVTVVGHVVATVGDSLPSLSPGP